MYVLEFKNREGSPLFHLEHFIEGEYIKYNSNSGFVENTCRMTPQVTNVCHCSSVQSKIAVDFLVLSCQEVAVPVDKALNTNCILGHKTQNTQQISSFAQH